MPDRKTIHARLAKLADSAKARVAQSFFKTGPGQYGEGDRFFGIRVPQLRELVKELSETPLEELVAMLASQWHEERLLALLIMVRRYQRGVDNERQRIYDAYVRNTARINNWDLVDTSAGEIVGAHLRNRSRAPLTKFAKSGSLWERRIAIIATFHYIKEQQFEETLRIARILLHDQHDLIQKAVGWMLREIGNRDSAAERAFLDEHAAAMPRTMLRYSIERFPPDLRAKYMAMRRSLEKRTPAPRVRP